jgi:hypothetical protein
MPSILNESTLSHTMARHTPFAEAGYDLDSYNIIVPLAHLLTLLTDRVRTFQLICHIPPFRDHYVFKKWVFVAGHPLIRIPPEDKATAFQAVRRWIALIPAPHTLAFCRGTSFMTLPILVECLEEANVESVRILAYGLKTPLRSLGDLGDPNHEYVWTNMFDIGRNHRREDDDMISLFSPSSRGDGSKVEVFPMLVPTGQDHGSVKLKKIPFDNYNYTIKVYLLFIYIIKSNEYLIRCIHS